MALRAKLTNQFTGEEYPEGYIRLNSGTVSKADGIVALIRGFASEQAYTEKRHFVWEEEVQIPLRFDEHPWTTVYNWLKTNRFPEAVDVLEGSTD